MPLIVQKFGGTSVGSISRIQRCIELVKKELILGNKVVVVVSAMAGVTDSLLKQANLMCPENNSTFCPAEFDVVASAGEQISAGLMAIGLNSSEIKSQSFMGWQLPISTNNHFNNAAIINIDTTKIIQALEKGIVPIIAGFQGIYQGHITTLGRGGTDTTAAAVSTALKADRCDIYTDVEGVFTADPNLVSGVRKHSNISYDQMLELALSGAKVVHADAISEVKRSGITMHVKSSFNDDEGTSIAKIADKQMVGIASSSTAFSIMKTKNFDRSQLNNKLFYSYVTTDNEHINIITPSSQNRYIVALLREQNQDFTQVDNLHCAVIVADKSIHTNIENQDMLVYLANNGIFIFAIVCTGKSLRLWTEAAHINKTICLLHEYFLINDFFVGI